MLRCLGRGWKFDDLPESTGVSEDVLIICFFDKYVTFGSDDFYEKCVHIPVEDEEVVHHYREFELAGLTGAIT